MAWVLHALHGRRAGHANSDFTANPCLTASHRRMTPNHLRRLQISARRCTWASLERKWS